MLSNNSESTDNVTFENSLTLMMLISVVVWPGLIFSNFWGPDISWWTGWSKSLQAGITTSDANYPPLFLYWLWFAGKIWFGQFYIVPSYVAVKTFISVPLLIGHLFVIRFAANQVSKLRDPVIARSAILFATLSPAVLYNVAWGQVDTLIFPFILLSIFFLTDKKPLLSGFFFAFALATKMQVVFFFPTICGAIFLSSRFFLKWMVAFLAGSCLLWLPWIFEGRLIVGLKNAYFDNLHNQPVVNVNATNFWGLFDLDKMPIHNPIFDFSEKFQILGLAIPSPTYFMLAVSLVGIFSLLCFWTTLKNPSRIWQCATLNCLAAFAFSPSMHERYLLPALLPALFAAFESRKNLYIFFALSICSFINMAIVLSPGGEGTWFLTSIFITLLSIFIALDCGGLADLVATYFRKHHKFFKFCVWISPVVLLMAAIWSAYSAGLDKKTWKLSELTILNSQQSWGDINWNQSVWGDPISIGDKNYHSGIGTHADSIIEVAVPYRANFFCAETGVQTNKTESELLFSIILDGILVWKSSPQSSKSAPIPVCVEVSKHRKLSLEVKSTTSLTDAHANWADAKFSLEREY